MVHRLARTGGVLVTLLLVTLPSLIFVPSGRTQVDPPVSNPICTNNSVFYDPGKGEDIVLPEGFKVSVFAKGLNSPTGIAFLGNKEDFKVFVLESGHGLPSRCNNEESTIVGGTQSTTNPFTPDILVFDGQKENQSRTDAIAGPLAKPTAPNTGLLPHGPAIDIAFEHGFEGGRLFATDSNQSIRVAGQNNSSRIVTVDPETGEVTPFITGLPTGDHPAEQLEFKDKFIFWSQGSTTNSGVVGHDNGGGANQQDIPCQDITLSNNTFDSGDGHLTSGYSPHGVARPGAKIKAFDSATARGMCDGAILRARLDVDNPTSTIEPVSWGFRNPFGIRFAPNNHALKGELFVTENGEDERGARPTNGVPDRLAIAKMNPDGTPSYHGWPDRFGFLDSTQAVFNPLGGPGDDLPTAQVLVKDRPVKHVLAFAPQQITAPLAIEPADVADVGVDFVPDSFVAGPVKRGAALVSREGDFGFSPANGTPQEGHDIQLVNFSRPGKPLELSLQRFARNTTFQEAFVGNLHGINRPVTVMFGPDGCAYLVDYGAVRDFGQSNPASKFVGAGNGPLVQIPGTGTIWKICRR